MSRISNVEMRRMVAKMYDAPRWRNQVNAMPDKQVYAIFCQESTKRKNAEAEARAEKRRAAQQGQPPANDDTLF